MFVLTSLLKRVFDVAFSVPYVVVICESWSCRWPRPVVHYGECVVTVYLTGDMLDLSDMFEPCPPHEYQPDLATWLRFLFEHGVGPETPTIPVLKLLSASASLGPISQLRDQLLYHLSLTLTNCLSDV